MASKLGKSLRLQGQGRVELKAAGAGCEEWSCAVTDLHDVGEGSPALCRWPVGEDGSVRTGGRN